MVSSRLLSGSQNNFHDFHVVRRLAWSEDCDRVFDLVAYFYRYVPCFLFGSGTYLVLSYQVDFIQVEGQQHHFENGFGGVTVLF